MSHDPVAATRGPLATPINIRSVPIIFVPGVMGSRLSRNGTPFWDPDNPARMLGLLSASSTIAGITLHADAQADIIWRGGPEITAIETARGWGTVSWDFYKPILERLQTHDWGGIICNVYAAGYDWRKSNKHSANLLQRCIKTTLEAEQATKAIIVSHSMGGLVTRWACKFGSERDVLGVVHVVQPVTGAVVAYRRFKTGASTNPNYADGNFFSRKDQCFTALLGWTAYKYVRVSHGVMGMFELLPTNDHPPAPYNHSHWLTWDKVYPEAQPPSNIYDVYREPSGRLGLFRADEDGYIARCVGRGIDSAEAFHTKLKKYAHPQTHVIAVSGYETDVGTHLDPDPSFFSWGVNGETPTAVNETLNGLSRRTYRGGDNTVPIGSATALTVPTERQHVLTQAESGVHAEVFKSDHVLDTVVRCVGELLNTH